MSEVVNQDTLSGLTGLADEVDNLVQAMAPYLDHDEGQAWATEMKQLVDQIKTSKLSLADAVRELEEALARKEAKEGKTDD